MFISARYQRNSNGHTYVFGVQSNYQINIVAMLYDQTGRNCEWKIQDGGFLSVITCNSACTQDSQEIPTTIPIFSGQATRILLCDVRVSDYSEMAVLTGSRFEITCISVCFQDTKNIPKVNPCFWSSNSMTLGAY